MNVQDEYRSRIASMSVVERVARAEALFNWSRGYLRRSILAARGPLSKPELSLELALRQYESDPVARQWFEELRTHVTR